MRLQSGVRSHFVTRWNEWGLSVTLLAFSAQLLRSGDAFGTSVAYGLLSKLVSESTWGFVALGGSGCWLLALIINGVSPITRRWTPWVRSLCAFMAFVFWAVNAVVFAITQPTSPGLINNAGFAFLALGSSIIIAREVGQADWKAKQWRRQNQTA